MQRRAGGHIFDRVGRNDDAVDCRVHAHDRACESLTQICGQRSIGDASADVGNFAPESVIKRSFFERRKHRFCGEQLITVAQCATAQFFEDIRAERRESLRGFEQ